MSILHRAWSDYIQPMISRPDRFQMAALCYRWRAGALEVLLITSLDTGRWILPKGWPMKVPEASQVAAAEAWEEAGVIPVRVGRAPIGSYHYRKRLRGGPEVNCATQVFPIEVDRLADEFPHSGRRKREWVSPEEAARRVGEPGLQEILSSLPARIETAAL